MYNLSLKEVAPAPEKAAQYAAEREAAMRSIMVNMGYEGIEIVANPEQEEVVSWWVD